LDSSGGDFFALWAIFAVTAKEFKTLMAKHFKGLRIWAEFARKGLAVLALHSFAAIASEPQKIRHFEEPAQPGWKVDCWLTGCQRTRMPAGHRSGE